MRPTDMDTARYMQATGRIETVPDQPPVLQFPQIIAVTQLQTTSTTAYTTPSYADMHVTFLRATNVTSSDDYVTLYIVPDGGSPGASNTVAFQQLVRAKRHVDLVPEGKFLLLEPSSTLRALCGVNDAVNLWGNGIEYRGRMSR